jgi:hypothetical protein
VQLWWVLAEEDGGRSVFAASAVLEVLEPPAVGRRYSWGVQAGVVDSVGSRVGSVIDSVVWSEAGSWSRSPDGSTWSLGVSCPSTAAALVDLAVWMELAEPPDDPPVVVRWPALRCRSSAESTTRVDGVQVTFPTGPDWRRLDVVVDEVGVLMVTNTRRTARNLSVLGLPTDR